MRSYAHSAAFAFPAWLCSIEHMRRRSPPRASLSAFELAQVHTSSADALGRQHVRLTSSLRHHRRQRPFLLSLYRPLATSWPPAVTLTFNVRGYLFAGICQSCPAWHSSKPPCAFNLCLPGLLSPALAHTHTHTRACTTVSLQYRILPLPFFRLHLIHWDQVKHSFTPFLITIQLLLLVRFQLPIQLR